MRKRVRYLAIFILLLMMPLFLGSCNIVDDFINTTFGYLVIGGLTLYLVFKYGGNKD